MTSVLGGLMLYPLSRGGDVLRFYREFCPELPDAAGLAAGCLTAPDGTAVAGLVPAYTGDLDAAVKTFGRIEAELGRPLANLVGPMTYAQRQTLLDRPNAVHGSHRYWRSAFSETLTDPFIDTLDERAGHFTSPMDAFLLFYLNGAATRVAADATAFAARKVLVGHVTKEGVIAGPRTLAALGLAKKQDAWPNLIPGVSVQAVSQMFPHTPIGNIEANLPPVCDALTGSQLTDKPMILMALATIRAETESFEPVAEGRSRYNTSPSGHPFDLYDNRRDLGNQGPPDGERYRGRGYIQLTGRDNYRRYGKVIGLGNRLLSEPELASEAKIAGRLLAAFIKDKELRIKEALLEVDLRTARRLVNGGSHGLDRFEDAFRRGQEAINPA